MEQMSSAAKVGQLFLVTFPGAEVTENAIVAELIRDYHIGGVVLLPDNGNITNEGDTASQVATLARQLQQTAWDATQAVTETLLDTLADEETAGQAPFVPIFIAVSHEGNGAPFTSIAAGTTPLPSAMALGATWNPEYAQTVGQIVGQELHALGINMLLGPSLDVLETPRSEVAGDLGVRAFGGEPFWVGQMGQMYIRGVHEGADGRIAVVAKHFPGLGTSERSLSEEISTVQRTLEKLRQIDLAPFATVAQAADPLARPDGLMVSHIRFRGLEGGRFVTTRPTSVDSQVLQRLLQLPELAGWRETGGVTVSDGLGVRALRRFYDPSEEAFNGRRIAQEALYAGNDVLLLSQFALSGEWEDQVANIKSTIAFFREKYDADPSFQTVVDEAVARILRLKLSLYGGSFSLRSSQPSLSTAGQDTELNREALAAIGRDSITLLSPPSSDLAPAPPTAEDNIVIFTDTREEPPCATCAPVPLIPALAVQDTIARLYGPETTGQINPALISSFTFEQLEEHLSAPPLVATPEATSGEEITPTAVHPIDAALEGADWIIFAMLDPTDDPPQSNAVRRFLAERADTLRDPRLIVLAYDAPYHLDATEISKLTAYFVAFSRTEPSIEASVRALFGEFAPVGASPVSVTGINYDLLEQISPDPEQTITLDYHVVEPVEEDQPTPEPTPEGQPTPEPPKIEVGDELRFRTSVILDHNGHPVPGGTPVQFFFSYPQEGLEQSITAVTQEGIAESTLALDRTGQLDISIQADPVPRTVLLQITIQEGGETIIERITPTPRPTPVVVPTPTDTPEPEPVIEETPEPTITPEETAVVEEEVVEEEEPPPATVNTGPLDLVLALAAAVVVSGTGYYVTRLSNEPVGQALRAALWCMTGGLIVYVIYMLRVPGAAWLREHSGVWASAWLPLLGSLAALGIAWVAARRRRPA
jgi:beta-N-acetylhexosaminidase